VILVLLLLAIAVASTANLARAVGDRWAVEGARRAAGLAFDRARAEAVARGGALLQVDTAGGVFTLETGGETRRLHTFATEFGVVVRVGDRSRRSFRYDPAGIGRVANATVRFHRGDAESRLTVSLFGRVRP
jgi:hypothetical protein